MLSFLCPRQLLTPSGFEMGFNYIRFVIRSTHSDPFIKLLDKKNYLGPDPYFHLQLLHLVARKPYRPLLEYIMAACSARFVSNPEHLLAIDTTRDYRGDTVTSMEFNNDAYEVKCLFHGCRTTERLFVPFVMHAKNVVFSKAKALKIGAMKEGGKKYAYECIKRHRLHSLIIKKANDFIMSSKPKKSQNFVQEAPRLKSAIQAAAAVENLTEESSAVLHLLDKMRAAHKSTVLRAVGVTQNWKVLAKAVEKFSDHKNEVLKSFLIGKDMGVYGVDPAEEMRMIWRWA